MGSCPEISAHWLAGSSSRRREVRGWAPALKSQPTGSLVVPPAYTQNQIHRTKPITNRTNSKSIQQQTNSTTNQFNNRSIQCQPNSNQFNTPTIITNSMQTQSNHENSIQLNQLHQTQLNQTCTSSMYVTDECEACAENACLQIRPTETNCTNRLQKQTAQMQTKPITKRNQLQNKTNCRTRPTANAHQSINL